MTNEQLVTLIRAGENVADNMLQLWQQNRGLIGKIAEKYRGFMEMQDLEQEGYIGLCEAVRHYNPEKGAFTTCAVFWIRQGIRRFIDNCGTLVRIPASVRSEIWNYEKIVKEYQQYCGEYPSESALCQLLGVGREKLHKIQKAAEMGQIQSLSEPQGDEGEPFLEECIPSGEDLEEDITGRIDFENVSRELWISVESLPDQLPAAVRLKYREGMTPEEIGASMGITPAQAQQMERKALSLLRRPVTARKFRAYYEEYLTAAPVCHVGVKQFNVTWTSAVEKAVIKEL